VVSGSSGRTVPAEVLLATVRSILEAAGTPEPAPARNAWPPESASSTRYGPSSGTWRRVLAPGARRWTDPAQLIRHNDRGRHLPPDEAKEEVHMSELTRPNPDRASTEGPPPAMS